MKCIPAVGLAALMCLATVSAEEARFALQLRADGTYVSIETPSEVEGSEPFGVTLELLFKPTNCSLQGLMAQRVVLGDLGEGDAYHGPDVEKSNGDAVAARDTDQTKDRNDHLRRAGDYLRNRDIRDGGKLPLVQTHGRGLMVDGNGMFVAWSRDARGVWRGVTIGECTAGQWTQLALVQQGEFVTGYLNGAKRKHIRMHGHLGKAYLPFYTVGRLSDGRAASFYTANGQIDEVRVYTRALTHQDVRCGADTRITGRERGLAAYLRLDEGAGTELVSMALPHDVHAMVVGDGAKWVPANGARGVQISADAPPAASCVYDLAVADTLGVHFHRLREGEGCPNECSGNGKCDIAKGECLCYAGFVQEDCSQENYQGYALHFDGTAQFVQLQPMGLHNSVMMQAWVRADDIMGRRALRADDDLGVDGASLWEIQDGQLAFAVTGNEPEQVVFDYKLEPGRWYFLTLAYSRKHADRTGTGSATLYVDGDLQQVIAFDKTQPVQLGAGRIGGTSEGDAPFQGDMDEFRILARVHSPRRISYRHASARMQGDEEGLLAYYRFDEGRGTLAIDSTRTNATDGSREFGNPTGLVQGDLDGMLSNGPAYVVSDAPFLPCDSYCNDHGRCSNATCTCEEFYGGKWCDREMCPNFCSHSGHCVFDNSTLRYADMLSANISGLAGEATSDLWEADLKRIAEPGTLLHNLTINVANTTLAAVRAEVRRAIVDMLARDQPKQCECYEGFYGADCSGRRCPNDCSARGICINGTCGCEAGWAGLDCSEKVCMNDCSDHGECLDGTCICDAGFSGEDCAVTAPCNGGCSGHGMCMDDTCDCDAGWTGMQCEWGTGCPNFCSGRGRCIENQCICDKLFGGSDCSEVRCPRDCSGHGDCVEGQCTCEAGFSGDDCSLSALWPMRCSTVHSGRTATAKCRRGWVLATPPVGSQVLEIAFSGAGVTPADRFFKGTFSEQDRPIVRDTEWYRQAEVLGQQLADSLKPRTAAAAQPETQQQE